MSHAIDRRELLARLIVFPIAALAGRRPPRPAMTVYKSPSCGCCKSWVAHVEKAGFKVTVKDMPDVAPIKKDMGVPAALASCHTALVGAYIIEGHVPADLIDKLLAEKPAGARGLAVPGMPPASPGMDMPGGKFDIVLFNTDGKTRVYATR